MGQERSEGARPAFDLIAFDADDTLWHNETLYVRTQERFKELLSRYQVSGLVDGELYETEMRNLQYYGYGIKGFTLSMIETAIELTGGRVSGQEIGEVIGFAKEMLDAPVRLLEHVAPVVAELSRSYDLMILTKGDLFDQETKVARSELARYFRYVEIVSEKDASTFQRVLDRHEVAAQRFLMVGNSMRSDILPVLEIGGEAVHIPYHTTWAHEVVGDVQADSPGHVRLAHIGLLPAWVMSRSGL